ncbi:MAG: FtsX-like permease family protein [Gammaproteobacteria bacterium]|jgi:putative ABC transport system permease protein
MLLRAGLRYMLRHRWQGLLALTGIALGVAVVLAVDLANSGARAAFELSAQHLQGRATHRLVVPGATVPDEVYVSLQRQSGAPGMAPVVKDWVGVEGIPGRYQLVGFDLFAEAPFRNELARMSNRSGFTADWLTRPGALVLGDNIARTLGVAVGESLNIVYRGKPATLSVLQIETSASAAAADLLLVDIATAKSVLDMQGRLSYVDMILDADDEQWIRQRIPAGVELQTVAEQAQGVTRLSAAFELNLTAMSLLALLVGMFLIFNAMTFSMVQRRTLFGRLRAIGVTPRELFSLILLEAVILAVLGTSIGLLLGIWLGQGLTRLVTATVSELYYKVSVTALNLDASSLLIAIGLGVLATLAATLIPAWHAARTPPLTTLSRAALEQAARRGIPLWALFGLVLLLTGLLLALVLPGGVIMSFAGLFSLVLGAAMMTPMVIRVLHRILARAALPGIWRMGVRDLDRHLSRLGIAVAALMVALSASVGVGVMVESMRGSVNTWLSDLLRADLYVAAEGFDQGALLPPAVVTGIAQLQTVAALSRYRDRSLPLAGRQVEVIGAHMAAPSRQGFALLKGASSAWQAFDAGAVLVSEPLAYHLGLKPGSSLQLPTPEGPLIVQVAAIYRDYASEHGRIFIDESVYREAWPDQQVNTLALFARDGDVDAMRREISELATHHAIVVTPSGAILQESMAVFDRTFRVTEVLRAVSLVVAFIGVLSALMALQLERSKEYAVLRALGLTRGQIAGLISGESLLMGLLAACVAIPTGLLMAWVLIESVQRRAFGWTMPFSVDGTLLLQTLLVGLLAAGLAAIYPAWRSARRDPAPQLRED